MPKTGSNWWPLALTLSVSWPRSTSMMWPAPKAWPLALLQRYTADRNFCTMMVPSMVWGGERQLSQLPHAPRYISPK